MSGGEPRAPVSEVEAIRDDLARKVGLALGPDDGRLKAALARTDVRALAAGTPNDARWQSFMEDLLVHETYFFRHPRQFAAIEHDVLPELLTGAAAMGRSRLAFWSASCSTGEEAWTIGLVAAAALWPSGFDFVLYGSDLSARAIETARCAVYRRTPGLGSFRAVAGPALRRFACEPGARTWSPSPAIRAATRLFAHNLLDPSPTGPIDLILCRNTLIYMGDAARRRAFDTVAAVLRPGGYLVLGPAETPGDDPRFVPVERSDALLFRRTACDILP